MPPQTPPVQTSLVVQLLPSLHVVPFGAVGLEQVPVAGLHVPATWHESLAVHVFAAPPHTPLVHTSPVVHALPSLQLVPFGSAALVQTLLTQLAVWHESLGVHVPPHDSVPPQPFGIVPQLSPAGHDVIGEHAVTVTCAVAE